MGCDAVALGSLFAREARWVRHNAGVLVLVLLVLPSLFAVSTVAFQQVIPRDTPIAVVPENERVSEDELDAVTGVAAFFSRPHDYESRETAERALAREEVYAIFVVPHGLFDEDASVEIEMIVEEEMVPYEQPSLAIASILSGQLRGTFPAETTVQRTAIGEDRTLSEFLVSVGTVLLTMVYAFVYLPRVVADEQRVFQRIRVESSLWRLLAAKYAVFLPLMLVPVLAFHGIAGYLDFQVDLLAPGAVAATLLTFLSLSAIALGVMFLTRFATVGRMVNATLLFGTLAFSNLVYPAGFFSPMRRNIARLSPIHYAGIVHRGTALKGNAAALYADRYLLLAGFALASLAFLAASVVVYQRRA